MSTRSDISLFINQTAVGAGLLLMGPMMICVLTGNLSEAFQSFLYLVPVISVCFIIFMVNYWWVVPRFYQPNRHRYFYLLNLLLFLLIVWAVFNRLITMSSHQPHDIIKFATSLSVSAVFFSGSVALAVAMRNSKRNKQLQREIMEERRRHTEAELVWLKNQLNPHFLFNTLNNISALTAIDPERAQECIGKLSDLLRYALYESSKPLVPLRMEVDFMQDYISLMSLRCSSRTRVRSTFDIEAETIEIAPLLMVNMIENAFKHGVSSSRDSEIFINMSERNGCLAFECTNTNHAKDERDKSGHGIGLANMRRRLDILYDGRYVLTCIPENDRFTIKLTIEL